MALETIEVRGTYLLADEETPLLGQIDFELTTSLQDAAGNVIYDPVKITVPLDEDGHFAQDLVATDATGVSPTEGRYRVTHRLYHPVTGAKYRREPYLIEVPKASAGGFIDLADVAPAVPVDPTVTYVLQSEFDTHVAGTAAENVHPGYLTNLDVGDNEWLGIQDFTNLVRFSGGPLFSLSLFIDGAAGDHYLGWKALIAAVNAAGTATIIVDVDTVLDEYRITGGTNVNAITDLQFLNVLGLTIWGMGHKFEVKGDFNREKQTDEGGASATLSYEQSLYLLFTDCEDVLVRDLELDGNVDLMTRDVGVTEGPSSGLFFQGCKRVLIDNVEPHHWMADGVKFGASNSSSPRRACELVGMRNVRSHNNARQALSPIQVRGLHAIGCELIDTGRTEGTYGNHAPSSGCDIEPTLHADAGDVDVETGLILIESSDITGNIGGTILCAQPKVDRVAVRNSRLTHPDDGGNSAGIFSCKGFVLDACDLDAGENGDFVLSDGVGNVAYRFRMRGGSLRCSGDSKGAVADDNLADVLLEDVAFVSDATAPVTGGGQFPFFTGNKVKVRYCSFFYPAAYFGGAAGAGFRAGLIKNGESVGNSFDTDFVPTTTEYLYVDTSGSGGGLTIARNDRYKNDAAKPIRPFLNASIDPSLPFGRGPSSVGDVAVFRALSNGTNRVCFDDAVPAGAAPNGGSWAKGDRVFNSNPSELGAVASKYVITGWICTVAGSPGTWLQMRALTGN